MEKEHGGENGKHQCASFMDTRKNPNFVRFFVQNIAELHWFLDYRSEK